MVVNVEEALENYRLITENANDLIRVLNDKLEIEYINESAHLEILGYYKDQIIGKIGAIPIHPEEYYTVETYGLNQRGEIKVRLFIFHS